MPNFTPASLRRSTIYPIQEYKLNFDDQNLSVNEIFRNKKKDRSSEDDSFNAEVTRFIEIAKYFSSPLRKTASYLSEQRLVTYPSRHRINYKRGGVTPQTIKFTNMALVPVYVKLFKVVPDLEQIKYTNLSLSRSKRIPPGLSFDLSFVYDDVTEKVSSNAQMIFIATKKTSTPCYQICEIDLEVCPLKVRLVHV